MTEPNETKNYRSCCGDQAGPGHSPDAAEDCHPCDCDCHIQDAPNDTAQGGRCRCGTPDMHPLTMHCGPQPCPNCGKPGEHRQIDWTCNDQPLLRPAQGGRTFEWWKAAHAASIAGGHGIHGDTCLLECWNASQASAKPIDAALLHANRHKLIGENEHSERPARIREGWLWCVDPDCAYTEPEVSWCKLHGAFDTCWSNE